MGLWQDMKDRFSIMGELWQFMRVRKKWWLLPILVVIGALSVLMLVGGSSAAPFIYTFF